MTHLLLTVRFLDDRYHGLLDRGGPPEWPPSPFRLFQAMVAGVARRGELVFGDDQPSNKSFTPIGKALGWLQKHSREHPPVIIAPKSRTGQAITRFVPNNDGDKKFDRQERLAAKPTIPTLLLLEPNQKPEVHYVWDIRDVVDAPVDRIRDAARSLTTLGWGIDMAFADAVRADEKKLQTLKGIRWYPKKNAGSFRDTLRIPTVEFDDEGKVAECTLCDLRHCHDTATKRLEHGKPLKTVDKPKVFDRVLYTSVERPIGRPYAVFKLLDDNEEAYRYPHPKLIHIAGMVRHLAIERMTKDPPRWIEGPDWISRVIRGKRDETNGDDHKQFSYLPLASIGHEHADAMIRNVMVIAPLGLERELNYLAERLDGQALKAEGDAGSCEAESRPLFAGRVELRKFTPPRGKFIAECYLGKSRVWHTVTPIILDGHDDKRPEKTVKLIQNALQRAGIEAPCEFTWQSIPFLKNCLSAHKYDRAGRQTGYLRPTHLNGRTAVHLRISFGRRENPHDLDSPWIPAESPIPGPIAMGAGRHCGMGVFAAVDG